jgi:serine/threonine protein kinase
MQEVYSSYDKTRQNFDTLKLVSAMGSLLGGHGVPADAGKDLADSQTRNNFSHDIRSFLSNTGTLLSSEETVFQAAEKTQKTQRVWVAATSVMLALLAGAVGFALWRGRVREVRITQEAPSRPLPAPVAPGSVQGNYRIEREIGRGGMGLVYEATDLALNRKVAIKRMRPELAEAGPDLEKFLAEARLVAGLRHPNLVEIYAIIKEGDQVLLVFELVRGQPLSQFLEGGRRISLRSTKSVLRQVGSALDYAHGRKVIHRDLKPANIMITPEGVAKVMDFGIAHQAKLTVAKMTRTEAWGTPPYMAPEQELGVVSRQSDLFSLGVVLYEMLTGRLPYPGPNFLAQKQGMLFPPPSAAVPGLGAGVDAIVRRALHGEPKKRFSSAAEFISAIDALSDPPAAAS